ncbi:MAG: hypothetical protein OEV91_09170 [Desulfobulbaceae bacterium]|nr:hypothetical protein [Desulfobulbaceae bacterium]
MTITDETEFLSRCEVAKRVIDYVGTHEQIDGVKWFFRECRGERSSHRYQVTFRSWNKPRYERFLLAVEAIKLEQGAWEVDVVKKVICGV